MDRQIIKTSKTIRGMQQKQCWENGVQVIVNELFSEKALFKELVQPSDRKGLTADSDRPIPAL